MIDDAHLRAMSRDERWRAYAALRDTLDTLDREEAQAASLAVEGRPAPRFKVGDYFRPESGSTVYRVIDFVWEEGHRGYWRYQGYSDQWRTKSHPQYVEYSVYYMSSVMTPCDENGASLRKAA